MSSATQTNDPAKWVPKLFLSLKDYKSSVFIADLIAGVTVGLVALPLAMAFGIASGVTPEAGLYTAVVAGFLISALGGSKMQIGGPTGAFVAIVGGIIAQFGLSGLLTVTLMAGIMLTVMAVTGLGTAVKFIPRPVTIGFTNGIAILIASTQIKDFLGLNTGEEKIPSEFIPRMQVLYKYLPTINLPAVILAASSLILIFFWPRITKKIPGTIVALVIATFLTAVFSLPVETIGTKFGGIPSGLPKFHIPELRFDLMLVLLPSAITVALLAAIESLLSAVVADGLSGDKHNSNVELFAQGIANIASPFFGGIPATGAIARTATNIRSGARTPVAGIIHALTLLLILLVAAPLARFIPLATLAAVLFFVAYNMSELHAVRQVLRLSSAEVLVWAATFLLTVFADLTIAVEVGMLLAALLYIRSVSDTSTVALVTKEYLDDGRVHILQDKVLPPYVSIIRIHGPFLFGATESLHKIALNSLNRIVILRLRNMTAIDATGIHALEEFTQRMYASGRRVIACGLRPQPQKLISRSTFYTTLGPANFLPHVQGALDRADEIHRQLQN